MGKVRCSAPARVDLSGGAADIFGLSTLSVAIDIRASCTICENDGGIVFDIGEGQVPLEDAVGSSYEILKKIVNRFDLRDGLSFTVSTDIPRSSGLGGSASLAVSIISCLDKVLGLGLSDYLVAEHAQRIETMGMKLKNGYQDQYCSTFGGCVFMDFKDKGNREVGEEPLAFVERLPFEHKVVIASTGIEHNSGDVNSIVYDNFHRGDPRTVGNIRELDVLTRALRDALKEGDYPKTCSIVERNQEIIREFGRSLPENERLIRIAMEAGADAAKVTGAGCGGSIAAICGEEEDARSIERALKDASPFARACRIDGGVRCEV